MMHWFLLAINTALFVLLCWRHRQVTLFQRDVGRAARNWYDKSRNAVSVMPRQPWERS